MGVHHVLMSLLNVIELFLLLRCEQGPDLDSVLSITVFIFCLAS